MKNTDRREAGRGLPEPLEVELLASESARRTDDDLQGFLDELRAENFERRASR